MLAFMEATFDRYESKLNSPGNINTNLPRTAFHSTLCFHFMQGKEHINGVLLQSTSVLHLHNRDISYCPSEGQMLGDIHISLDLYAFIMHAFSSDPFQIPVPKGFGSITRRKIVIEPDCSTDLNM
jgi:hypothetical protein